MSFEAPHSPRRKDKKPSHKPEVPSVSFPGHLPISAKRQTIVETIRKEQVVIITGETGSGKTTQIPKMCLAAGRGRQGLIGLTQPRRIAAVSIANRIASELGQSCGDSVAYKIRFDEKSSSRSLIKVMTDGVLLAETVSDRSLRAYDTIIVDEAHERSLNIDFLLGYLRMLLARRKDLKLIITSATIDTVKFSQAFGNAPVIEVSGRMFPVEVRYAPVDPEKEENGELTYIDAAVSCVENLQNEGRFEDILIFLPTEQDIRETCDRLSKKCSGLILPLYARLSAGTQKQVFTQADRQKIIVATNIAETSLTIPGIKYVIDSGLARILEYNPRSQTTGLPVKRVSKSSAEQRKGRCGRVQDGICIRLYSPEDYGDRPLYTPPEILRSNLAGVILRMLALNLGTPATFPFIDRPQPKSIRDGIDILRDLGAIRRDERDPEGEHYQLTDIGKTMAGYPLDPRISRMVIEAQKEGSLHELAVIASALSIQDPRERPFDKADQAAAAHARFLHPESDFLGFLQLWNRYAHSLETMPSQNRLRKFCRDHFLSYRRMVEWRDIYRQIIEIATEGRPSRHKTNQRRDEIDQALSDKISRCVLTGHLSSIAQKKEKNVYTAARGREVMLHPGSGLFNRGGPWIVASEISSTSRLFARNCANINPDWLEDMAGEHCRHTYWGARWEKNRGEVVVSEKVTLFGLTLVEQRTVAYDRINPEEAKRIFIRDALVTGEIGRRIPFLEHNLSLWEKSLSLEDKLRTRGIVVDEESIAALYEKRLPVLSNLRTLMTLIRDRGGDDFLRFREEDFIAREPDRMELSRYPDSVRIGSAALPCDYRFEPGRTEDGVTVQVPLGLVAKAASENLEKQIPSLLKEKVLHLLKALPKSIRQKLPPAGLMTEAFLHQNDIEGFSLPAALSRFIFSDHKITVPLSAWAVDKVPLHLSIRYQVIDERGCEIQQSRDISELHKDLAEKIKATVIDEHRIKWEKDHITAWNFGTLPQHIELAGKHGVTGFAYPALCVADDSVCLRLFFNEQEARRIHPEGVAQLYALLFSEKLKQLKKNIALSGDFRNMASTIGPPKQIDQSILNRIQKDLFARPIYSDEDFFRHADATASRILPYGQQMVASIIPLLCGFSDAWSALQKFMQKNRMNAPVLNFLKTCQTELQKLVPANFPERYGDDRLREMPRYMKALTIRAERGCFNLPSVQGRLNEIAGYCSKLEVIRNSITAASSDEKRSKADNLAWMIEEYKVSLFAQELKTPYPVSPKRLDHLLCEIADIVI